MSNNALSFVTKTRVRVAVTLLLLVVFVGAPLAFKLIPTASADTNTPVSIATFGVAVTENFNTLATSGTTNTATPTGWGFSEAGTNANTTYSAGTGSSTAGDTYSFGATSSTERAFGGLQSGTLIPTVGAAFTNNTGGTITSLDISYTGEMWRAGVTNRNAADRLDFQISTNATSLVVGTYTDVDALDLSSPNINTTAGALDGNAAANRTFVSSTITGLSIANGATFFIRWTDFNIASSDDGLAIDDFSLTANGVLGDNPPGVTGTTPTNGAVGVPVNSNITINFNESVNAAGSSFAIECPTGTPRGFGLSASPSSSFTLDPTSDLPANTVCTVTVFASGITDADTNDPPDNMTSDFSFSFTTEPPQPPVATNVIINEIDSDTPGTDAAEFVELYDGGVGNTSLAGLVLVFYNGATDTSYRAIDLDAFTTNASGYFTAGNAAVPGVDAIFPGNTLQNGEDAVVLYVGNASSFPNGTAVTAAGLQDAIVYDTNDPDDPGLLVLLNSGQPQVNESENGNPENESVGRCPNGDGGQRNTSTYIARTPTPDGVNNCPPPPVPAAIHDIQGAGATSPFAGQSVITTGIVTARKSNGFFVQEPDASVDGNSNTSEGIFVFSSKVVAVGDGVMVTGSVSEFFNLTQISASASNVVIGTSGNPLPAPIVLTTTILNPAGPVDQLERFEGMRMHADTVVSVAPTNNFGETFTVLDGVARPLREPGIEISLPVPPDPTSGMPDCCIPRWDENPERIMIDSDGLLGSTVFSVTSNVTLSNITGPLDFTFGDYKVLPETTPTASANMSAVPVPTPVAGEFTVAGYNIENFNNNATQRLKAALAIRTVMHYPDVIGHVEILDLTSLQALANQVNNDAVAAGDPNPMYEARLIPSPLGGTQNVGFLIKTARVQINSVTQERAGDTFINPNSGLPEPLHDRPPLVLHATVDPSGINPRDVIVVVNHTRSFIDIEGVSGEGVRVRAKRTAQAESIADLLNDLQTLNPTLAIISVGDYNAYQFNDGYTDPISVLKGTPTADDQVVVDQSPDLVNPDFFNLTDGLPANQRYSFIFEGTPQAIDHVLVNTVANSYVQRYHVARNNADFPELPTSTFAGDSSRPERNSDHDMPVAYFMFPPPSADLSLSKTATASATAGSNVTYTIVVGNGGVSPAQNVVVTDNLPAGTTFVSCNSTGSGVCGGTGNNRTVTFASLPNGASETITIVASVNCDVPNNQLVSNTASVTSDTGDPNGNNNSSTASTTVSNPPPTITGASANPSVLWPPNHEMVDITINYNSNDDCGGVNCTLSVTSNEPVDGDDDGNTSPDWEIVDNHHVRLRAERSGIGNGRVYTITITCVDAAGGTTTQTVIITVPKNKP